MTTLSSQRTQISFQGGNHDWKEHPAHEAHNVGIVEVRERGMPVILISHNMPHVFEVADRIHIHRLGRRIAVITPSSHTMNDAVAIMTGAMSVA